MHYDQNLIIFIKLQQSLIKTRKLLPGTLNYTKERNVPAEENFKEK